MCLWICGCLSLSWSYIMCMHTYRRQTGRTRVYAREQLGSRRKVCLLGRKRGALWRGNRVNIGLSDSLSREAVKLSLSRSWFSPPGLLVSPSPFSYDLLLYIYLCNPASLVSIR
ncbi:hypothetical protein F4809DRAFT_3017 [Biscogniauxia mediterranea]|nr:hypothetical protein F4809DRAFT_3017 [Biscogniauxia mediterranea]